MSITHTLADQIVEMMGLAVNEVDREIIDQTIDVEYNEIVNEIKTILESKGITVNM